MRTVSVVSLYHWFSLLSVPSADVCQVVYTVSMVCGSCDVSDQFRAGLLANVTYCWLVASPTGQRDTGFCVLPSWCYASADHCHLPFMLCEQSIHHLTVILSQGLLLRPPCLLESSCQAMYPHSAGSSVMLPAVSSPLEETHNKPYNFSTSISRPSSWSGDGYTNNCHAVARPVQTTTDSTNNNMFIGHYMTLPSLLIKLDPT